MDKYLVSACQLDSQNNKAKNLLCVGKMIEENARKGAKIIAFPETMNFMGKGYRYQAENIPGETTAFLCEKAKEHAVWIVSGSFPEIDSSGNPKNTLVLINPQGEIVCRYSKLHMFDVELNDGTSWCTDYLCPIKFYCKHRKRSLGTSASRQSD